MGLGAVLLAGAALVAPALAKETQGDLWPKPEASVASPAVDEARVREIVAGMTLEQKVGQMTQPSILAATPDDVRQYYIGSILNGGGGWPNGNKHASVDDWLRLSDAYYKASMSTDMAVKMPVIWGTDAVHGHNNVYGTTLFPHNIGLGAAHDPGLMMRIGRATAEQVRATGITWAFAPTLAVVQNPRWGRTYESYSSDPALVKAYGEAMVRGLQGELGSSTSVWQWGQRRVCPAISSGDVIGLWQLGHVTWSAIVASFPLFVGFHDRKHRLQAIRRRGEGRNAHDVPHLNILFGLDQ